MIFSSSMLVFLSLLFLCISCSFLVCCYHGVYVFKYIVVDYGLLSFPLCVAGDFLIFLNLYRHAGYYIYDFNFRIIKGYNQRHL